MAFRVRLITYGLCPDYLVLRKRGIAPHHWRVRTESQRLSAHQAAEPQVFGYVLAIIITRLTAQCLFLERRHPLPALNSLTPIQIT
jgi:hypothetical protein